MAARQAAEIFATVFTKLAESPDDRNKELALWLWKEMGNYDFYPRQMGCNDALMTLGLAEGELGTNDPDKIKYLGLD